MDALNFILTQLPAYVTAALAVIGGVAVILATAGAILSAVAGVLPVGWRPGVDAASSWCRAASADVVALAAWVRRTIPGAPPALALLVASGMALSLSACTGSFEVARLAGNTERASLAATGTPLPADPKRCQGLDDNHRLWSSLAKAGAAVTGASGLATIPDSDPGIRIGLAVGAVAVGAFTALAVAESDGAAESWSRECTAP
jgi:hypothetical protein